MVAEAATLASGFAPAAGGGLTGSVAGHFRAGGGPLEGVFADMPVWPFGGDFFTEDLVDLFPLFFFLVEEGFATFFEVADEMFVGLAAAAAAGVVALPGALEWCLSVARSKSVPCEKEPVKSRLNWGDVYLR